MRNGAHSIRIVGGEFDGLSFQLHGILVLPGYKNIGTIDGCVIYRESPPWIEAAREIAQMFA